MKKKLTRWALHKIGTEQFGYLCLKEEDAQQMFDDLKKFYPDEAQLYEVKEVEILWS